MVIVGNLGSSFLIFWKTTLSDEIESNSAKNSLGSRFS